MKNMKAMKGRSKAVMSLLQVLHVLHGENTCVYFYLASNRTYLTQRCRGGTRKSDFLSLLCVSVTLCDVMVN